MTWAPDYVTSNELKHYLKGDDYVADTSDDAEIALYIPAASRAVDRCTGRQFGKVAAPELRYYPVRYDRQRRCWVAQIDDLQTTAGLVLDPTGYSYTLAPRNAVVKGLAWTRIEFASCPGEEIAMTAAWGWSAFPGAVKLATSLQAHRFAFRKDAPQGVAGSPDQGSELRLLDKVDPDVAVSLGYYVRRVWAA